MSVQTLDAIRDELNARHSPDMPWRALSPLYGGVPAGTLCAIAKGRNPKKHAIRAALGLPIEAVQLVEARACDCGCGTAFYPRTWNQKRMPGHPRHR
ncbi:MAG: hypothetical protein MUP86_02530 [Dehalococcoidia bacterium]|nr:hypothetical protein [Dehalococcoidia bacterium]